ncbi:glycoside hydrolase family 36 protein [Sphingomonas jatrophae]|uniref:Alpha-galactosidase n=1 Tax=Sphingomonas jatrophae TaxID=1166337 RepID=A0A1I6K9B8_9SPHN|nr:glycoside hydrolase family 36 protein [Sphingomonas jatrophae]SFR87470.1 alpha-galactosidase [Sphingomonas jatrophae]
MHADFARRGIKLGVPEPLIDGAVPPHGPLEIGPAAMVWPLDSGGTVRMTVAEDGDMLRIDVTLMGNAPPPLSLGLRFAEVRGAERYLRNGYQSWDGSYFVAPGTPAGDGPPAKAPTLGFAATALLPAGREAALVLGFERHDRFQTRFGFGGDAAAMQLDVETLLDRTGAMQAETLLLFDGEGVEAQLRRWSALVAAASPLPPRLPERRLTGWCSWYNLYAAIDEGSIREHLAAARDFRDRHAVPLDIFQIDDGFTPEMGDWLDVKPQFAGGMAPLLAEVAAAGFVPGLWFAPFLVGNRSRLFTDHTDWLVQDIATGGPLVAMRFYGEFRWHKRSEEYHVLDVTHPEAAAYISGVVRTWVHEWGARYLKADFLLHGAEYGPERARWHQPGLSRIAIWRRMMTLIREAAGEDVLISGCGSPLWASVGLVDAVRIGRDIGVSWHGEYSAESLLRDLQSRNHANGTLWQADPDCVLLRDRFHELTDAEVDALAHFAAGAGGVLMTSDRLDELPPTRAQLFADLLRQQTPGWSFPRLGHDDTVIEQVSRESAPRRWLFNLGDKPVAVDGVALAPHAMAATPR